MLAIQGLKKQLRGIRSTRKLTKAMRTVATVKFSKLNDMYGEHAKYGQQCRKVFKQYGAFFQSSFKVTDPSAPSLVLVMTSNKGLCGNFNAEVLRFAEEELEKMGSVLVAACGKKAIHYFQMKGRTLEKEYVLDDIPSYEESSEILKDIIMWREEGKISQVYIIYPQYKNMMNQIPRISTLFFTEETGEDDFILFIPDEETVTHRITELIFKSMFYSYVLETAVGAQAATLMTMRSAYDTATEYYEELESEINRMRQSAVTADVIETAVERKEE